VGVLAEAPWTLLLLLLLHCQATGVAVEVPVLLALPRSLLAASVSPVLPACQEQLSAVRA